MQTDWLDMFKDPGILTLWGIVGSVLIFIVVAYKFATDPEARLAGIRQIVFEATGIRPSSGGFVFLPVLALLVPMVCFGAGMILHARSILRGHGQTVVGWLLIGVSLSSGILIRNSRTRGVLWIYEKLLGADYAGALARADLLIRWFPGASLVHFMRGTVLLFAGRLQEADESLRAGIARGLGRGGAMTFVGLDNLGCVLLRLGRVREATLAFEAVTKIHPQFFGAHIGLAESLLSQGQQPQRALLLLDNALKLKDRNLRSKNIDRHTTANIWADRALALAMLGKTEEAAASVEMAKDSGDLAFIPGLAGTAWRCGLALARMEKFQAAREQFQHAATMDPQGLYGKLAAAALQEQIVSR